MTWTAPRTWVTGEIVSASMLNTHLRDNTLAVGDRPNKPACRVYNSANISINNATATALTFDTERYDTNTMHSTSSNTGRITFTTAGRYLTGANINFAANATGLRAVQFRLNGTTLIGQESRSNTGASIPCRLCLCVPYVFAATDYVEVLAYQDSGAALNVLLEGNTSPEFWAELQAY